MKRIHLIGIKGIGMSWIEAIMKAQGWKVTGSDLTLKGHSPKNIRADLDLVVHSSAVTPTSEGWVEVEKAKRLGIPVYKRAQMMGKLLEGKYPIVVSGIHGKTTVSAMIGLILEKAGFDPTVLIGGQVKEFGDKTYRLGKSKYFVVEGCEYDGSFLYFRPKIGVVLNIEPEHLDYFTKGLPQIIRTFKKFVKLIPKNGLLVANGDDKNLERVIKATRSKVKTFSAKKPWPGLKLKIPGVFNLLNATAAARVCHQLGVSSKIIKEVLNNFKGVRRRSEILGERGGVKVLDDYAHHPTEIKVTLAATRQFYKDRRLICVFQPHQYARTKILKKEFGEAFSDSDLTILADIWSVAGREEDKTIHAIDLVNEIKKNGGRAIYLGNYQKIIRYLKNRTKKGDIILVMGATPIWKVGKEFLEK